MYTPNKPVKWSKKEEDILRDAFATSSPENLLDLLPGRKLSAIYRKASSLGLHRYKSNEWTSKELDILIELYPRMNARHIMPYLPGRSLSAIYRKASDLCLSAYDNTETDKIIQESYGSCSLSQIARRLGSCCSSVRFRARVLGLI